MNDETARKFGRWLDAERGDGPMTDDEADAACAAVFAETVRQPLPPLAFTANTMARVAAARAADDRRRHVARKAAMWAGLTLGPVALYFGGGWMVSILSAVVVGALELLVQGGLQVATASDWSIWSLLGSVGRAFAAVMSDSSVTLVMLAMHGIAVAALVALQRLLGPEA